MKLILLAAYLSAGTPKTDCPGRALLGSDTNIAQNTVICLSETDAAVGEVPGAYGEVWTVRASPLNTTLGQRQYRLTFELTHLGSRQQQRHLPQEYRQALRRFTVPSTVYMDTAGAYSTMSGGEVPWVKPDGSLTYLSYGLELTLGT